MRPDSKLYIVPIEGGDAREMNCNLSIMNSWHSWSPNGKWMVFSSKGFSPFTQMFLTHIDDQGNDSPAILIPNSTAANRAVNIPEFLNGSGDAIDNISAPTQLSYKYHNEGVKLGKAGNLSESLSKFNQALSLNPYYGQTYIYKGVTLLRMGQHTEARSCLEKAVELMPDDEIAHFNYGAVLEAQDLNEAVAYYQNVLKTYPDLLRIRSRLVEIASAQSNDEIIIEQCRAILELTPENLNARMPLGVALFRQQQYKLAAEQFEVILRSEPNNVAVLINLAWVWATNKNSTDIQKSNSIELALQANKLTHSRVAGVLDAVAVAYASTGQFKLATQYAEQALQLAQANNEAVLSRNIAKRLERFKSNQAYTE